MCDSKDTPQTSIYTENVVRSSLRDTELELSRENTELLSKIPQKIPQITDKKNRLNNVTKYEIIQHLKKYFPKNPLQFVVKSTFKSKNEDVQLIIPVPTLNDCSVIKMIDNMTMHYDIVLILHPLITESFDESSYIVTLKAPDTATSCNCITNALDIISFHHDVISRYVVFCTDKSKQIYNKCVSAYLKSEVH
jgi:hypothetical protein